MALTIVANPGTIAGASDTTGTENAAGAAGEIGAQDAAGGSSTADNAGDAFELGGRPAAPRAAATVDARRLATQAAALVRAEASPPAEVKAVAEGQAAKKRPFAFVNLTIKGVSIDNYAETLGGTSFVDNLREILWTRLITMYPELQKLPAEVVRRVVRFDLDIYRVESGHVYTNVILCVGNKGDEITFESRYVVKCVGDAFTKREQFDGTWLYPKKGEDNFVRFGDDETLRQYVAQYPEPTLRTLVDSSDFTHAVVPGQLEAILVGRFPELELYFDITRLLHHPYRDPQGLDAYFRGKFTDMEERIRSLLRQKEIGEQEAAERLASLQEAEAVVSSSLASLKIERDRVAEELALTRQAIEETLRGPLRNPYSFELGAADQIEIQGRPKKTDALRRRIRLLLEGAIGRWMAPELENHRGEFDAQGVSIAVRAQVLGHRRRRVHLRMRDEIGVLLLAKIDTPGHNRTHSTSVDMVIRGGQLLAGRPAQQLDTQVYLFVDDVVREARLAAQDERRVPRRTALVELIEEKAREIGSDGDSNARIAALKTVLKSD